MRTSRKKNLDNEFDNCGRLFEKRIYEELLSLRSNGYLDYVYDENDLRKKYGWESVGVDFLLVRGDSCIAIQTKYCKTRRREDDAIRKFIESLDHVLKNVKLHLICGFWISRMKPFDDNMTYMENRNIRCIYEFDSMDTLIHNSIHEIRAIGDMVIQKL